MTRGYTELKLKKVTDKIVSEFDPEKIILFGSRAWGNPSPESDADILVVKNTQQSTRTLARQIDGSIFPRPFPLDLIVYTQKQILERQNMGDFFINDIITKGKILYDK